MVEQPKFSRRRFLIASGAFFVGTLAASCRKRKIGSEQAEEGESRKGIETVEGETTVPGRGTVKEMTILVQEMAGLGTRRPLTGGVPIAEGVAPRGTRFALRDHRGELVPLQTSVLSRWPDGSARWALFDFQAAPGSKVKLTYTLLVGQDAHANVEDAVVCDATEGGPTVSSGDISLSLTDGALLNVSDRVDVDLVLTGADGQVCQAVVESAEAETEGALRSTLSLVGAFYAPGRQRVFGWRLRASVYAGLSQVRLEPLILVDAERGIVQRVQELKLVFRPHRKAQSVRLGGRPGWEGVPEAQVRVFQVDDQQYRLEGGQGDGDEGRKAPGWAEIDDRQGTVAVALRDFWQQWPKSLEASPEGLAIGLFPRFEAGAYDHMGPWYKYQYLFDDNCYQLRTGQARRWDAWLDLDGDGASLARAANAPLIPVADPAEAIATGVWDAIVPAGTPETEDYDRWAAKLFDDYTRSTVKMRDYGAMNWGDWFGERRVNWGNHEYDTANQILIQFARTGDPRYFYVADTAARHSSEVDTVHYVNDDLAEYFVTHWQRQGYPPRAGMVHQHAVGHVGGFYPVERIRELFIEQGIGHPERPYTCLDPFNLGHVWTQGMVRDYFLTGDPFLKETVERIANNLAQLVEDREYKFMGHTHCGRTTGWPLLALGGAYEVERDERYLSAMRTLAEDALEMQDPVCGGWLVHPMAWDHCLCKTARHTGMAGFITAVLINGLSKYYDLSGDERLREAIDKGVTFLDNDTWREEWRDWRYTSCPATKATGQPGVVMMAHVNGARIAGSAALPKLQHLRVLWVAWKSKFIRLGQSLAPKPGLGKTYTSTMYGCAETFGLLTSSDADSLF